MMPGICGAGTLLRLMILIKNRRWHSFVMFVSGGKYETI
jgi:hypothetical protein